MTPPPRTPTIGPDAPATLGRRPYDLIVGEPVFSPDSQHFAYAAKSGDERFVVLDGHEGRRYQRILGLDRSRENVVFDDANHFHYLALRGDEIDLVEESF